MTGPLLEVRALSVHHGQLPAVQGVSLLVEWSQRGTWGHWRAEVPAMLSWLQARGFGAGGLV